MKAITNTLLFLFCFISCSQEKYKIRLDSLSDIKKGVSYSLDSVVYKVDTVYLETTDSCLIDGISSIKEMDGYYYITSAKNQALYKFKKTADLFPKLEHVVKVPENIFHSGKSNLIMITNGFTT